MKQLVDRLLTNRKGSAQALIFLVILPIYWLAFFKFFLGGWFNMNVYLFTTGASIGMSFWKKGWGVLNLS